MFRRITDSDPARREALFRLHPMELNTLLESAWELRIHDPGAAIGHPDRRSELPELPEYLLDLFPFVAGNRARFVDATSGLGEVRWDHLIYAYMVENTRIYEIFKQVLHEYLHGEALGTPTADAQHWLRATEELFYKNPPPFYVQAVVSDIRPDLRASRRNAYHRMFGMDLNHGVGDKPEYPYVKAQASNGDFVAVLEDFLREVWVAISNVNNNSGADPTDDASIANLAEKLHDMLRARRVNANLSREEFWFVTTMSWFHLSVEFDSPIVRSLRSEAASPEQRLLKVGQRVQVPAHKMAKSFFDLADPLSSVLTQIETGTFNDPAAVPALYSTEPLQTELRTIITHWSLSTGRDLKRRKVQLTA